MGCIGLANTHWQLSYFLFNFLISFLFFFLFLGQDFLIYIEQTDGYNGSPWAMGNELIMTYQRG